MGNDLFMYRNGRVSCVNPTGGPVRLSRIAYVLVDGTTQVLNGGTANFTSSVALRGYGLPGQSGVNLYKDGSSQGTVTIDKNGAWTFDMSGSADGAAHTWRVETTDNEAFVVTVAAPP
jgi:hypothetical protein